MNHTLTPAKQRIAERREKVEKLYYTYGFSQVDIARQLNVHHDVIHDDLKTIRRDHLKSDKAQDYQREALEVSRESLFKASREAAKLQGAQGAAIATRLIQATNTHVDTLQQLGFAQKAQERVEHSGSIGGSPFENGIILVAEELARRRAQVTDTTHAGNKSGRRVGMGPLAKHLRLEAARQEGLLPRQEV
jgi:predicted DNA-binding protein YlxM (UPF0122 family)